MLNSVSIKNRNLFSSLVPLLMLIGIYAVLSAFSPAFLKWTTIYNLMQQNAAVGIIALGASFVLITGGLDFTTGFGVAMIGVTTAKLYMASGEQLWVMLVSAVALGAIIGLTNGLIITKLKIQPFIATLAVMTVLQGLTMIIGEANTPHLTKPAALFIGSGTVLGLPMPFIIFMGMALISAFIMYKTKMGTYAFAIGGNEEASKLVGINVSLYLILVYIFAGVCTSIASLITISRVVIVMPNLSGTLLMDGIASAVIGGTSVSGGKGNVFGTVVGVFIIGVIGTALTYLKISAVYQQAAKGAFIIFALALDALMNRVNATAAEH